MKRSLLLMSTVVLLAACNSGPKPSPADKTNLSDSLRMATDTAGLADYQAWKAQNELGEKQQQQEEKKPASKTPKKAASGQTAGTSQAPGESSAGSGSGNTAQEKKGWSKTAKGAVIGGVVGAGTGAVVNKKNRAAGAVVGGVVGAGAGAVIGHQMDKKDGRH